MYCCNWKCSDELLPPASVNCWAIYSGVMAWEMPYCDRGTVRVARSKAVEVKFNVATPGVSLDSGVPFRGLTLVNSRKPNTADSKLVTRSDLPRGRLAALHYTMSRIWRGWRRPVSLGKGSTKREYLSDEGGETVAG